MGSDSDPLSLVFVLIFFSRRVIFTAVSELSFSLHLQQVIAQLGELHIFLGRAGPSASQKLPRQSGASITRRRCFATPVSAGSSSGCGSTRGSDKGGCPHAGWERQR